MTRHYTPSELVKGFTQLQTLPTVYVRVREVVENPRSQSQDLMRELATDPAMTARVLRLVNSPMYGQARRVETLMNAVSVLGSRAILELVLASTVVSLAPQSDSAPFDAKSAWREAVRVGAVARALGVQHKMAERERLFVEGLLCRIGLMVMQTQIGAIASVVARHARAKIIPLHAAQRQFIGCHYGEVGAALLRDWQLPERICDAVAQHLEPPTADELLDVSILRLATMLAESLDEPLSAQDVSTLLKLTEPARLDIDVEELLDLLEQARGEVRELERALLS